MVAYRQRLHQWARPYAHKTWLININKIWFWHLLVISCLLKCYSAVSKNYKSESEKEKGCREGGGGEDWGRKDWHGGTEKRKDWLSDKHIPSTVIVISSRNLNCLFINSWKRLDIWIREAFTTNNQIIKSQRERIVEATEVIPLLLRYWFYISGTASSRSRCFWNSSGLKKKIGGWAFVGGETPSLMCLTVKCFTSWRQEDIHILQSCNFLLVHSQITRECTTSILLHSHLTLSYC